jgi:hypothetical protein
MKKRVKSRGITIVIFLAVILIVPMVSAGFFGNIWDKITGRASSTAPVTLNISISNNPPNVWNVTNISAITLTDGPGATYVIVNFSVTDADGASNLNNATAAVNFTKAGEDYRANSSCAVKDWSGNYANYSCNVTMWYWDGAGSDWKVYANISDLNGNTRNNDTRIFTVNPLTGFVMSPSAMTFSSIIAGATNQTPSNYILMNNTGNTDVSTGNVQINATDLVGETTKSQFLRAGNFSASIYTGNKIECNVSGAATAMVNMTYTGVANTVLAAGNYSKNDGTGQENVYMCLREAGLELSQQYYSTNQFGSWTVKII